MSELDLQNLARDIAQHFPTTLNGADKADAFALLAHELELSHLLVPDARIDGFYDLALPETAPELYRDRANRKEGAFAFIKRVYGDWLGQGLAQHHIRHLDHGLYHAMHNWLRGNDWPEDVNLPTKKQLNDQELERLGLQDGDTLESPPYHLGLKDRLRLYNAARNRAKKG